MFSPTMVREFERLHRLHMHLMGAPGVQQALKVLNNPVVQRMAALGREVAERQAEDEERCVREAMAVAARFRTTVLGTPARTMHVAEREPLKRPRPIGFGHRY